ncbi:DUF2834 domain-containing protein [Candidatus Acetothermia bacterium]|nr:DUF2834 domain-containing protein [Candidatus Acetothermia bacterium]MBI3642716.1 DUF2834 domain-containing protein [Candidatus Acetothermia bacterium]
MIQSIYLALCVLGIILPYSQFVPFLQENGLNLPLFLNSIFATPIGGFAWWDVIVSAVALLVFMRIEGHRLKMKARWAPVVALLLVGVSLALPLFLYLRERALHQA